ncbi:hypothetical protein B0T18DRAFT_389567 [Schizothecium vesticola]|uniref:Uncharacterized protein n=1 Tax=Schizothecium vesticola TaxID=314040 RepID=A0AA40F2M3_9PEZI|nr:hypothetical protein B0T18DRAFT_389567 [Schizothecium vesticola]
MLLPTFLLTAALPAAFAATPVPPTLTHLFSVNLTFSAPIAIGSVPYGSRDLLFISGGTFAGPKLSGKVTGGLDWGLTDTKGVFSPDAVYALQTTDNATIAVFERGFAPHVHVLFETASEKYAWLNKAVAYAGGGPAEGGYRWMCGR